MLADDGNTLVSIFVAVYDDNINVISKKTNDTWFEFKVGYRGL